MGASMKRMTKHRTASTVQNTVHLIYWYTYIYIYIYNLLIQSQIESFLQWPRLWLLLRLNMFLEAQFSNQCISKWHSQLKPWKPATFVLALTALKLDWRVRLKALSDPLYKACTESTSRYAFLRCSCWTGWMANDSSSLVPGCPPKVRHERTFTLRIGPE